MRKLARLFIWLVVLAGCGAAIPVHGVRAQDGNKPYQQWTVKEAEAVLINSAWAQTLEAGVAVGGLDMPTPVMGTAVTLRLRSALPLRQAMVRLRQLKAKYDKMGDSDKAAFDTKNKPLLECPACDDYYVVSLNPGPGSNKGVPNILQTMSFAQVKLNVQLKNEKGETRELVNFVNPKIAGEEAVFFFSRFNSKGEPLISPQSRILTVSFDPRIFEGAAVRVTKFDFDVAKMTVDGRVLF